LQVTEVTQFVAGSRFSFVPLGQIPTGVGAIGHALQVAQTGDGSLAMYSPSLHTGASVEHSPDEPPCPAMFEPAAPAAPALLDEPAVPPTPCSEPWLPSEAVSPPHATSASDEEARANKATTVPTTGEREARMGNISGCREGAAPRSSGVCR
jgi:hypothetical protein